MQTQCLSLKNLFFLYDDMSRICTTFYSTQIVFLFLCRDDPYKNVDAKTLALIRANYQFDEWKRQLQNMEDKRASLDASIAAAKQNLQHRQVAYDLLFATRAGPAATKATDTKNSHANDLKTASATLANHGVGKTSSNSNPTPSAIGPKNTVPTTNNPTSVVAATATAAAQPHP